MTWLVFQDNDDGPFITQDSNADGTLLFEGSLADAEIELCRACDGWVFGDEEDEGEGQEADAR